ncbi:MAG: hypothetical protein R3A48_17620 [Polyangiales bacterium]
MSVSTDIAVGLIMHTALNPSMGIMSPVEVPSIETPINLDWPAGRALNKHKLAKNVTILERPVVQDGHDVGPFTFDVTPYPIANLWYAVIWPFASRKTAFSCSKVQAASTPVAGAQLFAPLPMMTCGDPLSLPTCLNLTSMGQNVIAGFSLSDIFYGALSIAVTVAVDAIFAKALNMRQSARLAAGAGSAAGRRLIRAASRASVKGLTRSQIRAAARMAVASKMSSKLLGSLTGKGLLGTVSSGVISYARSVTDGSGEWTVSTSVGSSYLGAKLGYTANPDPSRAGAQLQVSTLPVQITAPLNSNPSTLKVAGDSVANTYPTYTPRGTPEGGSR